MTVIFCAKHTDASFDSSSVLLKHCLLRVVMTLINCSWVERSQLRMLSAVTMQTLKRTIQPICADNCIGSHDVFL